MNATLATRQSARFIAESAAGDGWTWPVQVIEAGPASGSIEGASGVAHYFTESTVSEFATAASKARFGRRHPMTEEEQTDPTRIAGYFSDGVFNGRAAQAKLHLFKNETALRDKLLQAHEAGMLDMFGLSILAFVGFEPGVIGGKKYLVSTRLARLMSVDLVTEAGAGGKFLTPSKNAMSIADRRDSSSATRIAAAAVPRSAEHIWKFAARMAARKAEVAASSSVSAAWISLANDYKVQSGLWTTESSVRGWRLGATEARRYEQDSRASARSRDSLCTEVWNDLADAWACFASECEAQAVAWSSAVTLAT